MKLRARLAVLAVGTPVQREAADYAVETFQRARDLGPHRVAADLGMPVTVTLTKVAHEFASAMAPAPFLDVCAEAGEVGFRIFLALEEAEEQVAYERVRRSCLELGVWGMSREGRTLYETAWELARELADEFGWAETTVFEAAIRGFRENLLAAKLLLEGDG